MSLTQERDEWLMGQVADGRRDCLETLIRRHATGLLTLIHRMVADRHRGEEIFQEVFLSVWLKRHTYTFSRAFKPWLYGIAINACRASLRRKAGASIGFDEEAWWQPPAHDPGPSDVLVAAETATLVDRAVQMLPPRQRSVVVLRIWGELGYNQIAAVMECSENTVRSHMHNGLLALRKYLEPRMR